ncbi:spore germination protein GerPE [Paenibacillus hamazuiensis]|uniref:spore germination protein GerPE n=1 Tax=Paenibacillus hamazuiensis TaxID=2936508 RepID=UPI00200EA75B
MRNSVVGNIYINTVLLSSILQAGDNVEIKSRTKVLAIQEAKPEFTTDEGRFEDFQIFEVPIPKPDVDEGVRVRTANVNPNICVSNIKITSVTTSSVFQIGANRLMDLETRVKHIRQLERGAGAAGGQPQVQVVQPPT